MIRGPSDKAVGVELYDRETLRIAKPRMRCSRCCRGGSERSAAAATEWKGKTRRGMVRFGDGLMGGK